MAIDLSHPQAFRDGAPHERFDLDRKNAPVRWIDATPRRGMPLGSGFWSVTRYQTMRTVTSQPRLFSSHAGGVRMETYGDEYLEAERQTILLMDPPDHTALRRTVSKRFIPRVVRKLEARVGQLAAEAVDAAVARGECEFIGDIAADVPLVVIADLLGVAREDRESFRSWSDTIVHASDPAFNLSASDYRRAYDDLREYGRKVYEEKKRSPGDDLISAIAHSEIDGRELSAEEVVGFWLLILIAGNETSRNALGGALLAFDQHRDQRERLVKDRSLLPLAVEECLRYVSPVLHLRRTATEDTELDGALIRAGDKVVFWLPAANHDPEIFPEPHAFDIARSPNEHMAFGFGTHFCLGAHLARLEIEKVLAEVFQKMPNYEITGEVERVEGNFIQGFRRIPIRCGPKA